jgi:DNA-nicking Smr family endonuclease
MKQLDLHGVKHQDVQKKLDDFLWEQMQAKTHQAEIITGISSKMKSIVNEIVKDYGMNMEDSWGNPGSVIVTITDSGL